jgi:hypothetical protein
VLISGLIIYYIRSRARGLTACWPPGLMNVSFSHQCGVTGVVSTVHRAGADADLEARGCRKQSQLAVHVAARGALLQSTRSLAIIASWLCQTMNLTPSCVHCDYPHCTEGALWRQRHQPLGGRDLALGTSRAPLLQQSAVRQPEPDGDCVRAQQHDRRATGGMERDGT